MDQTQSRNIIFIGTKPIMTYVTSTLTQLSTLPKVTLKARGRRLTQAVDVSQMIVKRMNTVGYKIGDVRIASDLLASKDGKKRSVSTIEIDITSENN
ncbi:MAG: DNA-binding protein [Candidatus Nitrosoabyssus spongiisocia]|nr:MAG: DNA-binding protein [Nitrosopumilaceae archaeon AB1(1)]